MDTYTTFSDSFSSYNANEREHTINKIIISKQEYEKLPDFIKRAEYIILKSYKDGFSMKAEEKIYYHQYSTNSSRKQWQQMFFNATKSPVIIVAAGNFVSPFSNAFSKMVEECCKFGSVSNAGAIAGGSVVAFTTNIFSLAAFWGIVQTLGALCPKNHPKEEVMLLVKDFCYLNDTTIEQEKGLTTHLNELRNAAEKIAYINQPGRVSFDRSSNTLSSGGSGRTTCL